MAENAPGNSRNDGGSLDNIKDYLKRAQAACESGDAVLGMYLYMAAFEEATTEGGRPGEDALSGLKEAWVLACTQKERSLAEYIFERLEPYLSADEITLCAEALHSLAMDKLEEFGFSRDDLEDMAQIIQDDIEGNTDLIAASAGVPEPPELPHLTYANAAGYEDAIHAMNALGIGMDEDADFKKLREMLNHLHGMSTTPALDTILFRSDAREDANRFMMATLGELDMPTIHMRMEENYQGMPLLCVSAHAIDIPTGEGLRNVFKDGGVLVLEDLDCWLAPSTEMAEEGGSFFMMSLTRGAREAVALVRAAVESPDVYVMATASDVSAIDGFFLDMLEPMTMIQIELPTATERAQIWEDIAREHPSVRGIDRTDLVRLSARLPRADMYAAAREAIEEAYKTGLMLRRYQPVTRDNLFDKLAAYQALDSAEYAELEDEVIRDFRRDLSHIDDILREG
ncbi:ribonucleotide reductase subunit alpha [Adlercreutzia murintestinalis]|uniref:ribonucleotide reductase subunit alpha n=1 Tax=Adlercreutzia murintestinalis TaxID=2941325 RepID=UPI00203E04A9|nr:ribonucleotide reductase subunit alpha [Adlercreutzia murintestinalis]